MKLRERARRLLPETWRDAVNRGLLRLPLEPLPSALLKAPARHLRNALRGAPTVELRNEAWPADRPLVTVIVACFNYGRFVPGLVENLRLQTWKDFEVILVEGGSTDSTTLPIVRSFESAEAAPGRKIRCIYPDRPHTLGANRLLALNVARGKYSLFVDADDFLDPRYLEKAVHALETRGLDHVTPNVRIFRDEADLKGPPRPEDIWHTGPILIPRIFQDNCATVASVFRMSFWRDNGIGIFTGKNPMEDWDLWMRFASHGARSGHIPETLHWYRVHGESMTASYRKEDWAKEKSQVRARFDRFLADRAAVRAAYRRQTTAVSVVDPRCNFDRSGLSASPPTAPATD